MKDPAAGEYTDWRFLDYQPAAHFLPDALLPYISTGQTALDIGCGSGDGALFLAGHGLRVLGIDFNERAIEQAARKSTIAGSVTAARFRVADFLTEPDIGSFDVVLMIRLLTCFPSQAAWRLVLERARERVKGGGLVYVRDFCFTPRNTAYCQRYAEAARLGWRAGNFPVRDSEGRLLFVAHHHLHDELAEITRAYERVLMRLHDGVSMHGHPVQMFEFIGRKTGMEPTLSDADTHDRRLRSDPMRGS